MKLITAREEDSERLKAFFGKTVLPGTIDFKIERPGSFFDPYRIHSDNFETQILVDDKDEIQGTASLIFRKGFLNGTESTIGFATDLRIAPTRSAVLQWSEHFLPVLESTMTEKNCPYIFSAMERYDHPAYNTLLRPQNIRRRLPRYYLMRTFHIMSLHGVFPFAPKPLKSVLIKNAKGSETEEIAAYLGRRRNQKPIALSYDLDSFRDRVKRCPGLKIEDFLLARDVKGNLIGCAGPWDGASVQSYVPLAFHGFAHTIYQTLAMASTLKLVRRFPQPGSRIAFQHLTHLEADNVEVFYSILRESFSRLRNSELLVYVHFKRDWRTLPPRSFLATAMPFSLYTILPPNRELPEWLQPNPWLAPPDLESTWL